MPQYPPIHLLIDTSQDDYLIVAQANMQMLIAKMSEQDRQPVIFALANAKDKIDKILKATEFFEVEVV